MAPAELAASLPAKYDEKKTYNNNVNYRRQIARQLSWSTV